VDDDTKIFNLVEIEIEGYMEKALKNWSRTVM
jgi:hypothetical protein